MARAFVLSAPSVAGCLKMQCGQQQRNPRLFGGRWERQPRSRRRMSVVMCVRARVWMCGCAGVDVWAHTCWVYTCALVSVFGRVSLVWELRVA